MNGTGTMKISDCHNDLLVAVRHLRERGYEDPFGDFWLPQLQSGNVKFQVLPIYTGEQFVGEGALRRCLLLLYEAHHLAEVHAQDVAIVYESRDVEAIHNSGRIALLLAIEGAEPVGHSLAVLTTLYRLGVRMLSLSWNRRTMMADGVGEQDTGGSLTSLGVAAIAEMEHLGMMLDVSHLSEAGFREVARVARKPFLASHSSCRDLTPHPRNLWDLQLEELGAADGFVGINGFGPFISETEPRLDSFVSHVSHAISILGERRVGIGADFIVDLMEIVDPVSTGLLVDERNLVMTAGFQRPSDFPGLQSAVVSALGEETAARVLYSNLVDFVVRELH